MGLIKMFKESMGYRQPTYREIARKHHKEQCVECKVVSPLYVHHKDGNRQNNHPKNLEWRCRKHHLEAHNMVMKQPEVVYVEKSRRKKKWLLMKKGRNVVPAVSMPEPLRTGKRKRKRKKSRST